MPSGRLREDPETAAAAVSQPRPGTAAPPDQRAGFARDPFVVTGLRSPRAVPRTMAPSWSSSSVSRGSAGAAARAPAGAAASSSSAGAREDPENAAPAGNAGLLQRFAEIAPKTFGPPARAAAKKRETVSSRGSAAAAEPGATTGPGELLAFSPRRRATVARDAAAHKDPFLATGSNLGSSPFGAWRQSLRR